MEARICEIMTLSKQMKREKDWRGCLLIHLYEMCALNRK